MVLNYVLSQVTSDDDVYLPLELVLSWELLIPVEEELGKELEIEDSLVVVCGELGYYVADCESLVVSYGSLRSLECLVDMLVCLLVVMWISRPGSVTSSLKFLFLFLVEVSYLGGGLTGMGFTLLTGLSSNLVFLACLPSWLLSGTVSETKDWEVFVSFSYQYY